MAKWEKYLMVAMGVTTFAGLAGLLYMRRDPQFVAEARVYRSTIMPSTLHRRVETATNPEGHPKL
ncbi:Uncharacterized protein PBTT_00079 [Plasmodiophora brassicae]